MPRPPPKDKTRQINPNIEPPRRSSRHSTQSQSQTQAPLQDTQETSRSFLSVSTAPLPRRYEVHLALPANVELTGPVSERAYVRGEELLSDGWRRSEDVEGRLRELRAESKRVKGGVGLSGAGFAPSLKEQHKGRARLEDGGPLWYTSEMVFPCVCSLKRLKCAYAPSRAAPRLPTSTIPPRLDAGSRYAEGQPELPEWSTSVVDDLDPSLDGIEEFESLWLAPPVLEDTPLPASQTPTQAQASENGSVVEDSVEISRLRKGKYRAVEGEAEVEAGPILYTEAGLPARAQAEVRLVDVILPPSGGSLPRDRAGGMLDDDQWAEEMKRRKRLWRGMIRDNPNGYGKMWDFLPLPYSNPARQFSLRTKKSTSSIPPYKLPRTYFSKPHSFHPDLGHYLTAHPKGRVYWLIPIHGPVLVPTLNHPLVPTIYIDQSSPSRGVLEPESHLASQEAEDDGPGRHKSRAADIRWTRSLLLAFIEWFLRPLYLDPIRPFGALSYAFSGPKPDPFIDLPPVPPLNKHNFLPPAEAKSNHKGNRSADGGGEAEAPAVEVVERTGKGGFVGEAAGDMVPPVRPESGDHLRIYCDARYALQLRTWLHNIRIPRAGVASASEVAARERAREDANGMGKTGDDVAVEGTVRILYKTRLTLVGERGEVLIVA